MARLTRFVWKTAAIAVLVVVSAVLGWAFQSRTMLPLEVWHTAALDREFTAADAKDQPTLKDYLAREEALFRDLDTEVYGHVAQNDATTFSRYRTGSTQDPSAQHPNWNRTFELLPDGDVRGGVLLLHGLTDSPYSLRRVGEIFRAKGFYVLGLRLPGHGTIPGALTRVSWDDWVAASRIGARHVRERIGTALPFFLAGYSNGGGLSVKYALDAALDDSLPHPDGLLLFSPEIGIASVAVISNIGNVLTHLPYFDQFRWLSIEPEYDPYKYNSFPKNAAEQAWRVTNAVQNGLKKARESGHMNRFPPVLTFLSWTDSTVDTSATIQHLYDQLENERSELVIFDVNRSSLFAGFMPATVDRPLERLETGGDLNYRLTVVSNVSSDSPAVAARSRAAHSANSTATPLDLAWPINVYSLSHVAIPFAPDDPIYGDGSGRTAAYAGLPLGTLQPRGETSVLTVSSSQILRLRHNPFFAYLKERIEAAIDAATEGVIPAAPR
jgi:alpha-beta hydrolase superfamily lysophospholipase